MLADSGQNLGSHPTLEILSGRQLACNDEAVKTRLVDDNHITVLTCQNETFCQLIFGINMISDCLCRVCILKNVCYILAYKPRLAVTDNRAYLLVVKDEFLGYIVGVCVHDICTSLKIRFLFSCVVFYTCHASAPETEVQARRLSLCCRCKIRGGLT